MKRLLSNKGNLLFTTSMCLVVAMLGFSILMLVVSIKERSSEYSEALYKQYTYESYGRIAVDEVVIQLPTIECSLQYSPLADSRDIQLQLQESLLYSYVDEAGKWKYSDILPATVTSKKIDIDLSISNFNIILESDLDLQTTQVINVPRLLFEVHIGNYTYTANVDGLRLVYVFEGNKIHCRYNTDNVVVYNAGLTRT